jgi:hypothetical protein
MASEGNGDYRYESATPRRRWGDLAGNQFVEPRGRDASACQCSTGTRRSCVPKGGDLAQEREEVVRRGKEIARDPYQNQRGKKPMASEALAKDT